MLKSLFILSLSLLLALALAACGPAETPTPPASPTPDTVSSQALPQVTTPEPTSLTLWLPDWMAVEGNPGYDSLQKTLQAFQAREGVSVTVIPKLPSGPGGLLEWLERTQPVAPSLLPDVIALPFADAQIAAENDLLQPLTPIISDSILGDLYPFAQEASWSGEEWVNIPFAADFEHLAFQPSSLSEPPVNWAVVLSSNARYAFPYGGAETNWTDAILLHYLSAVPEGEDPYRNKTALRDLLRFYETAYQKQIIDEAGALTGDPRDTWQRVLQGQADMGETTASLWLAQEGQKAVLRFGPTPTQDGRGRYLMHGWSYAIVTADEAKQALAGRLLYDLTKTEFLSQWTMEAHVLPARRTALMQWPVNDYQRFLSEALEQGFLTPDFAKDRTMARSVHQAVIAVFSGLMTAEEAWSRAVLDW